MARGNNHITNAQIQPKTALNLSDEDLAMFAKIRIPIDLLEQGGVCRVTDAEARASYGCELKTLPRADMSGIVFPYLNPLNGGRSTARLRRDNPERKLDGRAENKYVCAYGDNRHLYFPPGANESLKAVSVPVIVVESEKAVLAIAAFAQRRGVKLLAFGTGGCEGWLGKTGVGAGSNGQREVVRGPLPDFGLITWECRETFICFDSNAANNPQVQRGGGNLAKVLVGMKANVKIAAIPVIEGVNGPDDFVGLLGDEAFGKILDDAEAFDHHKHLPRFYANEKGVWAFEYDKNGASSSTWLCSQLAVEAYTRDHSGNNWGRLLSWEDPEGRKHTWAMPFELLGGDGTEVFKRLYAEGLKLSPSRKDKARLLDYLQETVPRRAVRCVTRLGWHEGLFVMPDEPIGTGAAEVIYQSPFEQTHYYNVAGTLEDWKNNVARYCQGNSRLVFVVSVAFAGPLLEIVGEENGGFHFRGNSSTGKSTALFVAGSAWGGGGHLGFGHTWRATTNGLETVAELHNDGLLCLDELGQIDPREAGETAYLLSNGMGKARMSKAISARRSLQWTLIFLSSGEISLAGHMQTIGKRARAGQEVRLIDLPADAGCQMGLFENLHGIASPDEFSRTLSDNAKKFYGVPIRTYLDFVAQHRDRISAAARQEIKSFLGRLPSSASGEVSRAARRFALVAAAGELATESGVTGWNDEEARKAVTQLFDDFLTQRGLGVGDEEASIRQVRGFLEAHGSSRFQGMKGEAERVNNRAGFREETREGTVYLILPEAFRNELCSGFDPRIVASALSKRGFLETDKEGNTYVRRYLPEVGRARVYAVKSAILDFT